MYPHWLANPMLVRKANEKYRMCIYFTDLNQTYSKDFYPLSNINKLVDLMPDFDYLSSLDAIFEYHQIPMNKSDEEKTSFIIKDGTYCYKAMPFRLKNVGVTYQHLMNKIFKDQIGRNVKVCVDDMIVKSKTFNQLLTDLEEVFIDLRQYQMRLNLVKCAFFYMRKKVIGLHGEWKGHRVESKKDRNYFEYPRTNLRERCTEVDRTSCSA